MATTTATEYTVISREVKIPYNGIKNNSLLGFEYEVSKHLKLGWKLHGELKINTAYDSFGRPLFYNVIYTQVLIKETLPKQNGT